MLQGLVEKEKTMAKEVENNVVVCVFNVESEGYQALTELKKAVAGGTYLVSAAALVKKAENACTVLDAFDTGVETRNDTVIGGLIGMMLGIFGGPLGVLLGGSYGALVGASFDAGDAAFGVSMLDQIADKLDDGTVAIVALTAEENEDALDEKLSAYDAVIARFDAGAVADEVAAAYEKQYEMARQARMDIRKEKKEEVREKLEENEEIFRHGFTK